MKLPTGTLIILAAALGTFLWQTTRALERNVSTGTRTPGSALPVFVFLVAVLISGAFSLQAEYIAEQYRQCVLTGTKHSPLLPLGVLGMATIVLVLGALAFTSSYVPTAEDPILGRQDFQSEAKQRQVAETYTLIPSTHVTDAHFARVFLFAYRDTMKARGYAVLAWLPVLMLVAKMACKLPLRLLQSFPVLVRLGEAVLPAWPALVVFLLCVYPVWDQYKFLQRVWKTSRCRFTNKFVLLPFLRFAVLKQVKPFVVVYLMLTPLSFLLHQKIVGLYFAAGTMATLLHLVLLRRLERRIKEDRIETSLYMFVLRARLAGAEKLPPLPPIS